MHAKRQNNWEIISGISKSLPMMNNDPFILAFYREKSFMQAGFSGVMKEISRHQPPTIQLKFRHQITQNDQQTYHQVLGPDPLPTTWMDCHDSLAPSETRGLLTAKLGKHVVQVSDFHLGGHLSTVVHKMGNNWGFCSRLCTCQWIDFSLHPSCFWVGVGLNT